MSNAFDTSGPKLPSQRSSVVISGIRRVISRRELFLIYILIVVIISLLADRFLTLDNIANVLRNTSIGGVLVLGLTLVMIGGILTFPSEPL